MKIFQGISFNWKNYLFDLFLADDLFHPYSDDLYHEPRRLTNNALNRFFGPARSIHGCSYEDLDSVLTKRGKNRIAVLHAHEVDDEMKEEEWVYCDGHKTEPVQSWIDQRDGENYGALVIVCCNGERVGPDLRTTPIFFAFGEIGIGKKYETVLLEAETS
jgi:hypothetical protein